MKTTMPTTDNLLRHQLAALPEADLPQALWPRVDARRVALRKRFRLGAASACACLLVATLALVGMPAVVPSPAQLAQATHAGTQDLQAQLRAVDRALQVAYENGSSDAEIEPLWVVRRALFNSLQSAPAPGRGQI